MICKTWFAPLMLILIVLLGACSFAQTAANPAPEPNVPNPASAYCEQQGYTLEIMTAADGSQSANCIFPDGSKCDEWAFYRGECVPATPPAPLPMEPADYQGWWTYTQPVYNFSIKLPEDWVVEEVSTGDALLAGHLVNLHPKNGGGENIRMTFRRQGEDTLLWPTGVGQGEFVPQGTLEIAGQPAQRLLLVCPTGEVTAIWYHQDDGAANITRGDLEFGFIFSATPNHCEAGYSLDGKIQRVGEMSIASLNVP